MAGEPTLVVTKDDEKFWRQFGPVRVDDRARFKLSHPFHYQKHHRKLKTEVLTHYGNGKLACVRCGYSDIRALSIDHINGGGSGTVNRGILSSQNLYRKLKKQEYPGGYQTLCMNCQFLKREENGELFGSKPTN